MMGVTKNKWGRTETDDGFAYWSWHSDDLLPDQDHSEIMDLFSEILGWWKNANQVALDPDYDHHEAPMLIKAKVNRSIYDSDEKKFEDVQDWVTFHIALKVYSDADDVAFKLRYTS